MPFTPFHFGPGLLFKALGGGRFSFIAFVASQVMIDLEPLVRIMRGDEILHGWTHTLSGALVIGCLAGGLAHVAHPFLFTFVKERPAWSASFLGALVGTFSHLFLDGLMHHDMSPFSPISAANPLLGRITLQALHLGCLAAGVVGLAVVVIQGQAEARAS